MRGWLSPSGWKIGLGCAVMSLALWASGIAFLQDIELKTVDARFRLRGVRDVSDRVVIAAIDERSIDALGRWPWPRSDMAALVDSLKDLGARVIAFDIVFAEPERNHPENDLMLAESIERAGNVVLGYYFRGEQKRRQVRPAIKPPDELARDIAAEEAARFTRSLAAVAPSRVSIVRMTEAPRTPEQCSGVEPNISLIGDASKSMGYFSIQPDLDGVVRRIPLVLSCADDYYTSLSLRATSMYLGNAPIAIDLRRDGIRTLTMGPGRVKVDESGFLRVNFPGPAQSFAYYSAVDSMRKRVDPEAVRDRLVIVGSTELGIEDIRPTPFGPVVPGPEVQAAAIETILRGAFIQRDNAIILADVLMVFILGVGLGGLFGRLPGAVHRAQAFLVASILFVAWQGFSVRQAGDLVQRPVPGHVPRAHLPRREPLRGLRNRGAQPPDARGLRSLRAPGRGRDDR